jgi:restriction system protein
MSDVPSVPSNDEAAIAALMQHWNFDDNDEEDEADEENERWQMIAASGALGLAGMTISGEGHVGNPLPTLVTQTLIIPDSKDSEGVLIRDVTIAWREIIKLVTKDANFMYEIDPRKWEEIIAGSYQAAGYRVILTPRSGDFGRDVIAYKDGFGSVRFIESVKRYKPGNEVPADDVRALLGVLLSDQQATKGIISTTWEFAPKIREDPFIKPHIPYRLELVNGKGLIERFKEWAKLDTK